MSRYEQVCAMIDNMRNVSGENEMDLLTVIVDALQEMGPAFEADVALYANYLSIMNKWYRGVYLPRSRKFILDSILIERGHLFGRFPQEWPLRGRDDA